MRIEAAPSRRLGNRNSDTAYDPAQLLFFYRLSFLKMRSGMLRMMNMIGWKMPGT